MVINLPQWANNKALQVKAPGFLREFTISSGTPNASVQAIKGTLCFDVDNTDIYWNTDGATAWTKIFD